MLKLILLLCCVVSNKQLFCQPASPDSGTIKISPVFNSNKILLQILKPEITVYPNPAKNKITLQVKQFDPGMATVQVLDLKGKVAKQDSRLLTNGSEEIVMFLMLKAGIYFIQVVEGTKIVRKKIVLL